MNLLLRKQIQNFKVELVTKYGKTDNLLVSKEKRLNAMYSGRLTMNFRPSGKLNLSSYVSYQKNKRYLIDPEKNWFYGVAVATQVRKNLNMSFNYQSNYTIDQYYRNRSILDGHLRYTPNDRSHIDFSTRYNLMKNSLDGKEVTYSVRYVRLIDLPVRKKKNIGKLSGKIMNEGGVNVGGILLTIGNDKAVSDKEGNYKFPLLATGTHYVIVDYAKAGITAIPVVPGPYLIHIQPGKTTTFNFGLTLSSRIAGQVVIEKKVPDADKRYAGAQEQLGKLLVEARKGKEIFRTFTTKEGKFFFESLRPGKWTVKIYKQGIPKDYTLFSSLFHIVLLPGYTNHLDVKIMEKYRQIKFQKSIENTITTDFDIKPTSK